MKSRWHELKPEAVKMRRRGGSLGLIEKRLGIPRSTLSGWFKNIRISDFYQTRLLDKRKKHLIEARKKAVIWHNDQKAARMKEAIRQARTIADKINTNNSDILDLSLAMLYFGEGFKSSPTTAIGNSNPLILKFFIAILRKNYGINSDRIKCELHLRADQDPIKIRKYWSQELRLPLQNFTTISIDKRTQGSITYDHYKGVCVVRCGQAAIQRKLLALSLLFCEQVVSDYMGG
jgi:hypothetical protein